MNLLTSADNPWIGWESLGDADIPKERAAERLLRGVPSRVAQCPPEKWESARYNVQSKESGKSGVLVRVFADGSWTGQLQ